MSTSTPQNESGAIQTSKRPWQRPQLVPVGTVGDVLKAGVQKVTLPGDPGPEAGSPQGPSN